MSKMWLIVRWFILGAAGKDEHFLMQTALHTVQKLKPLFDKTGNFSILEIWARAQVFLFNSNPSMFLDILRRIMLYYPRCPQEERLRDRSSEASKAVTTCQRGYSSKNPAGSQAEFQRDYY